MNHCNDYTLFKKNLVEKKNFIKNLFFQNSSTSKNKKDFLKKTTKNKKKSEKKLKHFKFSKKDVHENFEEIEKKMTLPIDSF